MSSPAINSCLPTYRSLVTDSQRASEKPRIKSSVVPSPSISGLHTDPHMHNMGVAACFHACAFAEGFNFSIILFS